VGVALTPAWRLRLDDQLEVARFRQRSRYNYDYTRHDLVGEIERRWGIFSSLACGYGFGGRSVPDSAAIGYRRHRLLSSWTQGLGPHLVALDQTLERRLYADPSARSHFLEYQGTLAFGLSPAADWRLRPEYRAWLTAYDTPDSVYADAVEQAVELVIEKDVHEHTTLGLGPRAEFRRTGGSFDPPYDQFGVKGTISYLAGPAFWIQFTNEVGVRKLLAGVPLLDTDSLYNWTTLYLSCAFWRALSLDLFFSLSPESHEDPRYDTSTLLLSTALTWGLY
jgi:hypothetical protein